MGASGIEEFEKDYELSFTTLGQGEYSRVKEGRHKKTSSPVAVKLIKKSKLRQDDHDMILSEVSILNELSSGSASGCVGFTLQENAYFVQMYDFYDCQRQYLLVLEMMKGGELFDRIVEKTYYRVNDAKQCAINLLKAVAFLHERHVCHRDLKPENLLLKDSSSENEVKIADFGFSKRSTERMSTQCGTPGYVAPEILEYKDYGLAVDIWSAGVVLYTLLAGYPPFLENDQKELFRKIKSGAFEFHDIYWCDVPDEPKDLISKMLTVSPDLRISAEEALMHPWFLGGNSVEDIELMASLVNLRKFNGKRKLRAAVRAVTVTNRMERFADSVAKSS